MSDTSITLNVVHKDRAGQVHLDFQPWTGSEIPILFKDELNRRSGTLRFNGKTGTATIVPTRPYVGDLSDPTALAEFVSAWLQPFASNFTFGWSPTTEQMPRYDAAYHAGNRYVQGDELEIQIKGVQAQIIKKLAGAGKCVIAGCSNGELVRRCVESGIDAYGFDVIPNLDAIAFPEVRGRLREGSLTQIPFAAADRFETLIAVDVLEHIPERDLPQMVAEWRRLEIRKLILLINLNQFWFPGHITMRPLDWWADQWKGAFRLVSAQSRFEDLPFVYSNGGLYNQQWTCWGSQQNLTL